MNHIQRSFLLFIVTFLLAACGGGGGSSTPDTTVMSISGQVTSNSAPLQGVSINLTPQSAGASAAQTVVTDIAGNYTLPNLVNGSYLVTPTRTGFTFTPASTTVVISGQNVTGQNFTASIVANSISGTLTNNGAPLAGVSISVTPQSAGASAAQTVVTDALGNYILTGLNSGTYLLTPTLNGFIFAPLQVSVTVGSQAPTTQSFTATATGTKTATVAFSVFSTAKLPAPVQGVRLSAVLPAGTTVATDAGTRDITSTALVAGSGLTSPSKQVFGRFSSGKVTITVVNPDDSFRGGELARLTLSYPSVQALLAGDFAAPTLIEAFGHDTTTITDFVLTDKLRAALGVTFN